MLGNGTRGTEVRKTGKSRAVPSDTVITGHADDDGKPCSFLFLIVTALTGRVDDGFAHQIIQPVCAFGTVYLWIFFHENTNDLVYIGAYWCIKDTAGN